MSLADGRISTTRYRVANTPKKFTLEQLAGSFHKRKAPRLSLQGHKELIAGWIAPACAELGPEDSFDLSYCQQSDGFLLAFRVETRKVQRNLLQYVFKSRLQQEEAGGHPLGRKQKKQMHDDLRLELLQQALPELKIVEAFWDVESEEVWLFSSAKRDIDIFERLFKDSFTEPLGMDFIRLGPPFASGRIDPESVEEMLHLQPAVFGSGDAGSYEPSQLN